MKKKKKYILGIAFVILIPILIEIFFFNFNGITKPYKKIEYGIGISDKRIENVSKNNNIIDFELDSIYYVNRIFLNFSLPVNIDYQVIVQYEKI